MNYYTDLFTPETWTAFQKHGAKVTGFRIRQKRSADRIQPGDLFVCYLVRASRWCGLLRVASGPYIDNSPIFSDPDPFEVRFKVEPVVMLDLEQAIPIEDESVWPQLSLTSDMPRKVLGWAQVAKLRGSLWPLSDEDGLLLSRLLQKQGTSPKSFPLTAQDQSRLKVRAAVRTVDREVVVSLPEPADTTDETNVEEGPRKSHEVQADLARVGVQMGFRIWIPRGDRQRVTELVSNYEDKDFLSDLPLNYDDVTLKTIEQIDVIWLKGRSMVRAFEVEHSTAIYSGLLRMADLLALQPNMDIRLHIVAPEERREKVLHEITRPVFSLIEGRPLYERCSYIPYEAVEEISKLKHLDRMKDVILDDYAELAEDE